MAVGTAAAAAAAAPGRPQHLFGPRRAVLGRPASPRQVRRLSAVQRAESAALATASRAGRPVVVTAQTTPTVEVEAHPDGLLSMTTNVLPVRVKVHGTWRPIDPKLRRTAAGAWTASVASVPVTFSGGGAGPLVTVANAAGQTTSMYWPAALPRPAISGSVALYRDVLPGVDLRMVATGTGYSEALVVRDAVAAANPRLRSIRYLVRAGRGLVVRGGSGSSLGVVDAKTGKLIFVVGAPLMWDSSRTQHFATPASADAAGSGRITQVPVSYRLDGAGQRAATIVMAPPAAALTGSRVRYPVYIDPEISPNTDYYAEVMQTADGNYKQEWDTTSGTTSAGHNIVEIGYCGYSNCLWQVGSVIHTHYTDRTYFRFDTHDLEKQNGQSANVYYVSFDIDQVGNSDGCTNRLTDLYSTTGGIDSSTSWGGPQGSKIGTQLSNNGGGSGCTPGNVEFDSDDSGNDGLKSTLEAAADNGDPNVTLELRADAENDDLQYKTFTDNPSLSVYFNFPPQAPTGLAAAGVVTCDPSAAYTSMTQPELLATGDDNNPNPLPLTLNYTLETSTGSPAGGSLAPSSGASGSQQSTTPSTPLAAGGSYQFQATATNQPGNEKVDNVTVPSLTGPASAWYPFTVLSPPTQAPTISSFDYPPKQWGQPIGAPGVFTVSTGGASNIAGFAYSFDGGAGSEPVPKTTDCNYLNQGGLGTSVDSGGDGLGNPSGERALVQGSTAQIDIPANIAEGPHTLYVRSFDKAHNASAEVTYSFFVPPNFQASQPVTYIDGSSLVAGATGPNASLLAIENNCCGVAWRDGSKLIFNGNALNQTFTVTISVPDAGWWQLGADMTLDKNFGQVRVDLDQATSDINLGGTAPVPFDGYSPTMSLAYLDLGTQHLTAGNHTLTFTMTGQNASSSGFKAGINYITLSPTSRYEAESLPHGTPTAGTLAPQYLLAPPWSDNGQLMLSNTAVGTSFTVSFNAPVQSDYALGFNMTTGPGYGLLRLDLDPATSDTNLDNTASVPLDAYSSSQSATYVFLGGMQLAPGTHVLQVTVVGTDPASAFNRYNAGIDFLQVAPVTPADLALTPGGAQ